jgi:BirA family biotin operon repressor/biotin-[acetyl-CoA-carboxylase] ligase
LLKLQPKSLFVGQNQIYLPYCHSSNDVASEIGQRDGFIDGTLVITDFQTQGRGQRGTSWESENGKNLMMSLVLDTSFLSLNNQFKLSMVTSLGIVTGLKELGLEEAIIKWPNDIYIGEKKVGGVLIENGLRENKLRYSVIGMGLNVSQETFDNPRATCLNSHLDMPVTREQIGEAVCENIEKYFNRLKEGMDIKSEYLSQLLGFQRKRRFVSDSVEFEGIITGVSESGKLEVESEFSKKVFDIKEISFCF